MLTVPECEDRRQMRLDVGGIETEFIGQPDQPQEFAREKTHSTLNPAAAQHIAA
jgi:hypothetical protein